MFFANKFKCLLCCFGLVFMFCNNAILAQQNDFVKVMNAKFYKNNKPYHFMGTNLWYAMHLGMKNNLGNRKRLLQELDSLKAMGIANVRIMALAEGPDWEPFRIVPANNNRALLKDEVLEGLDFTLVELKKRDMTAVVCLTNFWPWSGGMVQYLKWVNAIDSIAYPMISKYSWDDYQKQAAQFYSNTKAKQLLNKAIWQVVNRTNTISYQPYKNDATIMAWELCNEPRAVNNQTNYINWIETTSAFIKSLDSNHLVTTGTEGSIKADSYQDNAFEIIHSFKSIDYTVVHIWPLNWDWYNAQKHDSTFNIALQKTKDYLYNHVQISKQLNKPLVLEEFGFARNKGSYNWKDSISYRDSFYHFVFKEVYDHIYNGNVGGVNFWAWSGNAKPSKPAAYWKKGEPFTGDPPHEPQGWYSIYNSDRSTKKIIKFWSKKFKEL
jgi:mannan endo-1,4-beta-mannosidase